MGEAGQRDAVTSEADPLFHARGSEAQPRGPFMSQGDHRIDLRGAPGRQVARATATLSIRPIATPITAGSFGPRPNSIVSRNRVVASVAASPIADAGTDERRAIRARPTRAHRGVWAPSAIRIPMSFVRRATA